MKVLTKAAQCVKMEISAEKTKLMIDSADGVQRDLKVKEQKLGTVTSFKNFGLIVSDESLKNGSSFNDYTSHCSSGKAETDMKR